MKTHSINRDQVNDYLSFFKFTVYNHQGRIVKRDRIMGHDMDRPPLEHAYHLLDKYNRDSLGAMVGVTGPGIHKVVYMNRGDVEPSEMVFDDMDIIVDQMG
ncbi:hypothetical protein [Kiloniella litopenaei]|uniref:hypothetical protein n=1 Tax=Kiloniella litopenaei TaxID=1549748 RepID=UPI003BAC7524